MLCNGQSITSSTYTELRNVLGTNTVPDFRQRFPFGAGTGNAQKYEKMQYVWETIPVSDKRFGLNNIIIDFEDIVDTSTGNKTTGYPSYVGTSTTQHRLFDSKRDSLYATLDKTYSFVPDSTIGNVGGEYGHVLTVNEMPAHTHTITMSDGNSSSTYPDNASDDGTSTTATTNSTGGSQAHTNMPPYFTINFIIKYSD